MTAAEWHRKRANEKVLEYAGAFFLIALVFLGVFGMIVLHSSGG